MFLYIYIYIFYKTNRFWRVGGWGDESDLSKW